MNSNALEFITDLFSIISEREFFAGWLYNIEFIIYHDIFIKSKTEYVTEKEKDTITSFFHSTNGLWPMLKKEIELVPFCEFFQEYKKWENRYKK